MEDWKQIIDNPSYEVSSIGNVRRKQSGRLIKLDKKRYVYASIYYDGKVKRCLVHRLVGGAFIPNPDDFPVIDHLNRDKHDNRVENLCWTTQQKNLWNKDYKGYSWRPMRNKYEAKIRDNGGKRLFLGLFDTEEEASSAYTTARDKLRK
jgi:hypothetical protein